MQEAVKVVLEGMRPYYGLLTDGRFETHHVCTHFTEREYHDLAAWEEKACRLRRQVALSAGVLSAMRFQGQHRVYDGYTFEDIIIEKVLLESLPGLFVAGNLYRPAKPGVYPAILNPHGHWSQGRFTRDDLVDVPMRCIRFAQNGFIALSYDMVGYGDSRQLPHKFQHVHAGVQFTPLALQVRNSICCVDFLSDHSQVDSAHIGCTGASGGGTQAFLLSAIDERMQACAPVNMVSHKMQGGCLCENAPGLRIQTNNMELAALTAPRPMLLVGCTGDWTNELREVEYPILQRIYALYGACERVSCFYTDAPHNYAEAVREHVLAWFCWLWKGCPPLVGRPVAEPDSERLRLYPDEKLPKGVLYGEKLLNRVAVCIRSEGEAFVACADATEVQSALWTCFSLPQEYPQVTELTHNEVRELHCARQILTTRERNEKLQLTCIRQGSRACGWAVFAHERGAMAFAEDLRVKREADKLLEAGFELVFPELFLLGVYREFGIAVGRNYAGMHVDENALAYAACYDPTDDAYRIGDIVQTIRFLEQERAGELRLYGYTSCAAYALCAAAATPVVKALLVDDWEREKPLELPQFTLLGGMAECKRLVTARGISITML